MIQHKCFHIPFATEDSVLLLEHSGYDTGPCLLCLLMTLLSLAFSACNAVILFAAFARMLMLLYLPMLMLPCLLYLLMVTILCIWQFLQVVGGADKYTALCRNCFVKSDAATAKAHQSSATSSAPSTTKRSGPILSKMPPGHRFNGRHMLLQLKI